MKVLIADDSSIMRRRLMDFVGGLECVDNMFEARDFAQTINGLSAIRPDVLILDIRMPGGSGIDVLQKMKTGMKPPVVIVFTNYADSRYFDKCMQMGADYFFDKSADIEKLVESIKNLRLGYDNKAGGKNAEQ